MRTSDLTRVQADRLPRGWPTGSQHEGAGLVPAGEEPLLQRHVDVILRRRAWRESRAGLIEANSSAPYIEELLLFGSPTVRTRKDKGQPS